MSFSPGKIIRNHPKTTSLAFAFMVLVAAGAGLYVYALHQWDAAQSAVKEGRTAEGVPALICV